MINKGDTVYFKWGHFYGIGEFVNRLNNLIDIKLTRDFKEFTVGHYVLIGPEEIISQEEYNEQMN